MSSTDRVWESPATFVERIWPVIDVYGRIRPLIEAEARPRRLVPIESPRCVAIA